MNTSIIFAGVGGQGVLTASSIVGKAALLSGINVVMSEVHGMAQRGGIVVTEMKIGEAKSPLIGKGEADIIVGFEPVEAYRALPKAHKGSYVIVNTEPIIPITASLGDSSYPEVNELLENMKDLNVIPIEATELARKAGDSITTNIVMLGALVKLPIFPIEKEKIKEAIKQSINPRYHELNFKAFEMGYEAVEI
ncbi:indolepyruvate ferredoxin oxidoreductase subunit beta [Candidatus Aciduliprofundum boonei]|uniref:Indolepyruvate ferredoxin oxidoreductase subunit beta n=1 Tax=Aciduliprofundum boonei (strain DSM 19572 / T469) TaxID=439481 RepID=B5IDP2_ACIB4|nr:indolepyruvate ferredoxin oxidoreductase subunit beta [Candidatus Aciduliprofundum boonei]ADD08114.1 indolepyruvate ferredoxin oxidoreductase, beta subunit [Aciduliprofundum boonei T469]EDY35431.1 indolepyruvate ferredoxin oxidoreductase, beta subunit [Aciduliprofundum boonei T469]EDY35650.1 indolepyruvate ferredoxin oxidoreductase, beta subunit [Aciduliprofundum boonei T469]HII55070.1 indolepyruvate ferredoxin oxidoreductase subunit beta [Candidatus Aciduliprofundum boonei]